MREIRGEIQVFNKMILLVIVIELSLKPHIQWVSISLIGKVPCRQTKRFGI